jgi:lipid-binding SYLF domain-containing protein
MAYAHINSRATLFAAVLGSAFALCSVMQSALAADAGDEAREHVLRAELTLSHFMRDPNMKWLRDNIGRATAVVIVPEVVKAGFIFGGSGGRAVVLARKRDSGKWAGPAFYTIGTASVGFQIGLEVSEVLIVVMTQKGLDSLLATSAKLGGDASIAAGPVGIGAAGDVTADMVSFNRAQGLYGGLNLTGSIVKVNDDWNAAYYYPKITPVDIFVRFDLEDPQSMALRDAISKDTAQR